MTKPRILFLTLKRDPFDLVFSGIKKEEYREIKPFWTKRLIGKQYDLVCFTHGYQRGARRVTCEFKGVTKGKPKAEWACSLFPPELCYIIALGAIVKNPTP